MYFVLLNMCELRYFHVFFHVSSHQILVTPLPDVNSKTEDMQTCCFKWGLTRTLLLPTETIAESQLTTQYKNTPIRCRCGLVGNRAVLNRQLTTPSREQFQLVSRIQLFAEKKTKMPPDSL